VVKESVFPDHHVYDNSGLMPISLSLKLGVRFSQLGKPIADALLTTEKDLMNLPPDWNAPLPLFACCIHTEIEEKKEFEQALLAEVEAARRAN
jgi:tetraacyldisaccharide-1-P 4'-kinase